MDFEHLKYDYWGSTTEFYTIYSHLIINLNIHMRLEATEPDSAALGQGAANDGPQAHSSLSPAFVWHVREAWPLHF